MILRRLRQLGILGINGRNASFVLPQNPRRSFPEVDDKVRTKALCERAGVPVPRLLGVLRHHHELRHLEALIEGRESFVLKPARGSQGKGVAIVRGREGERYLVGGRTPMALCDLRFHAAEILSGLFSLGGQPDEVLLEECLTVHPSLGELAGPGVPDVRVLIYRGVPVMGMLRLPTRRSGGRANLHQGAVGVGINLATGRSERALWKREWITHHPDTEKPMLDMEVPQFPLLLEVAVRAAAQTELQYLGVDLVVDATRGPLVLELNARPGLSIQLANGKGLLPRLRAVERSCEPHVDVPEWAFCQLQGELEAL